MESLRVRQRSEIRFCVQSGCSQAETLHRLRFVHGNRALSQPTVHRWWTLYQSGSERIKDLPCPGAPLRRTAAKVNQVDQLVQQEPRSTVRQLARQSGLSVGSTHRVLRKDLQCKKKSTRWIPHLLTPAQKLRRVHMARLSLQMLRCRVNPIPITNVVVEDESWIFTWDPESK